MASGHRRRVIEKVLEHGVDTLLEHEFLELCLYSVYKRRDTNPLAHALLDRFGNLYAVCDASIEELMTVDGIGHAAAEYIKLIPYISKGYTMQTSLRKKKVYTNEDIGERCKALLKGHSNEVGYVLCFDSSRHLIKEVKIAEGSPGSVSMDPRKIVEAIAQTTATAIVLCHNHPSGVNIPSQQDFLATHSTKKLVNSIGVELIDHIIVADDEFISCITFI